MTFRLSFLLLLLHVSVFAAPISIRQKDAAGGVLAERLATAKRELPGGGDLPKVDSAIHVGQFAAGKYVPSNLGSNTAFIQAVNSIVASGGSQGQDTSNEVEPNIGRITLEEFLGTGSNGASAHGKLRDFLTSGIDSGILGFNPAKTTSGFPGSQGVDIDSGDDTSRSNDSSGAEVKVSNTDSTTNGSQPPDGASRNSGNGANNNPGAPEHSGGGQPSDQPSGQPNEQTQPSGQPSGQPSRQPSGQPSDSPSAGSNQSGSGQGDGSQNNGVGDNGPSRNSGQGSNSGPSSPNSVQTPSASNGSPSDPSNNSNGAPNSGGVGMTKPAGYLFEVTASGGGLLGDLALSP